MVNNRFSFERKLGIEPYDGGDTEIPVEILESIELYRREAIARNSEIVTCDKCGTSGNRPNMMRWHFENCITEWRPCKHCGNIIPRQGIKDYLYSQKIYCNRKCYMESRKGKPLPPQVRYYGKSKHS